MTRPIEVIGEIVDEMRAMRRRGMRVSDIVRRLSELDFYLPEISNYLNEAFCLGSGVPSIYLIQTDESGNPVPETLNRLFEPVVEEARHRWFDAAPYPDLLRRRDRHTFRIVAKQTGSVIIVCAANPFAGQYVGKDGFRPRPFYLRGVSRLSPPNQGLIAADPTDTILTEILGSLNPPVAYARYVAELEQLGFSIGSHDDGYVIRDRSGSAFYPGYYIHGAYKVENRMNAWNSREGEKMRAELNRRMGEDLVSYGPHDFWDGRRDEDSLSLFRGPQPPVLFFMPDGNVSNRFSVDSMKSYYKYLKLPWNYSDSTPSIREDE